MYGPMETTFAKCLNIPFTLGQWLARGRWFSLDTPVSSTKKIDCHDITAILLKVALITISLHLHCNKHFLTSLLALVVFKRYTEDINL